MKSVLIITYYWPPSGGAGVQRWLKFTKYLREFGWEPVIYTPENPEAPANDDTLAKDIPEGVQVVQQPIWEPYQWYKQFIGQKKDDKINAGFLSEKEKPGMAEQVSVWIRGNFFIPDARKFWIKPSIKFLKKYLQDNPVDAIVSTGPPHSMHLIAMALHKNLRIPWLADFRDPWTQIDFYHQLKLTALANRKHHRLEKKVLKTATKVVTVGKTCAEGLQELSAREIEIIPNGFDETDFSEITPTPSEGFEIIHMGAMNRDRNINALWQAIGELKDADPAFSEKLHIHLIGKVDISVNKSLEKYLLTEKTRFTPYLPHHEAIQACTKASVLLLPLNNTPTVKGIVTGKLFEYLAIGKPILCIGVTDGDTAEILRQTKAGETFDFSDKEGIKDFLLRQQNTSNTNISDITKYTRQNLTQAISKLLDKML